MNTTQTTAQQIADRYVEIVRSNDAVTIVSDALANTDPMSDGRYEIVGELMDVAVMELGYDNDGTGEAADVLYDLAEDAADIVAVALAS